MPKTRAELTPEQLQKVDVWLKKLTELESNLGKDSTPEEIDYINSWKATYMSYIKGIDEDFFLTISPRK